MKILKPVLTLIFSITCIISQAQDTLNTPHVQAVLYLGTGENQPLVVGLGGSEGGNAWASHHWKSTRDRFITKGYAFLAIGYFGLQGTPPVLDKIALENVHFAITEACKNPKIKKEKIAIIGGSRGADLALLLGSYYEDIRCVIGLVPSHTAFPGHTQEFNSSCWTYNGQELPFVPVNQEAVPYLMKRDLRGAFTAMLKDSVSEQKGAIEVEKINGPILLISATKDEICPSTPMSEKMMVRLKQCHFKYRAEHLAIEGGHAEPLKHFDEIFEFLEKNF